MGLKTDFGGGGPFVVAHRGASSACPENTLRSFSTAFELGADAVELDVRLTADGVAVVLHDPDVSRTTDGEGLVNRLTLEEVKRLDASGGVGVPQQVPTLEEVLALASGRGGVMLEIKNIPGQPDFDPVREGAVDAALDAIAGFDGPALIASFNPRSIERSRDRAPDVPTGFLSTGAMDPAVALRYAVEVGHPWIVPNVAAVMTAGEAFVERAHDAGVRVGVWVEDDAKRMERLFGWNVDAVATNLPEVGVAVREAMRRR